MSSGVHFLIGLHLGQPSGIHLHVVPLLLCHVSGGRPALVVTGTGCHIRPVRGRVWGGAGPLVWRFR